MKFKQINENIYWLEGTGGDCNPEGTASEWREIVAAIRARKSAVAGIRLGMTYFQGNTLLYNTRNSEDYGRYYTDAEIDALATEIESVLGEN
jgi:hypothetical protein